MNTIEKVKEGLKVEKISRSEIIELANSGIVVLNEYRWDISVDSDVSFELSIPYSNEKSRKHAKKYGACWNSEKKMWIIKGIFLPSQLNEYIKSIF
jgi:hypothetical protein